MWTPIYYGIHYANRFYNELEIFQKCFQGSHILAQYDVEVNTARAEAEKAYQLQAASIQQRIQEQNTQVEIVERAKQIEIQEQEMARKEKELQAKIKKPAEAEKYRLEKIAEAERIREILKAEADAEARVMKGIWVEPLLDFRSIINMIIIFKPNS